ncbi:uncharacterized protein LOC141932985 [Strix aluco]|uniref:uncharacterized protein LOC141932985 n=1 Tax=Strix aluco TaxID=111821 RepID=UPI003DA53E02
MRTYCLQTITNELMRTAILQHRVVLDYLLAEEGGVCGKSNVSNCCLEIDDVGEVVLQLTTDIRKLAHVPVQTWSGWNAPEPCSERPGEAEQRGGGEGPRQEQEIAWARGYKTPEKFRRYVAWGAFPSLSVGALFCGNAGPEAGGSGIRCLFGGLLQPLVIEAALLGLPRASEPLWGESSQRKGCLWPETEQEAAGSSVERSPLWLGEAQSFLRPVLGQVLAVLSRKALGWWCLSPNLYAWGLSEEQGILKLGAFLHLRESVDDLLSDLLGFEDVPCWEREVLVQQPVISEGEEAASRVSQSQRPLNSLCVPWGDSKSPFGVPRSGICPCPSSSRLPVLFPDESPVNSTRTSWLAKGRSGRARGTSSPASQKSRVAEDFFDRFPAEGVEAAEGSSASGGEPQGLLQSLKGLDDLEADLLGASRPSSGPGKTTVKEPPAAQTPLCTATPVWKRKELTFEEDSDDLMAALGLGSGPGRAGRQGKKAEEEEVRPARAKLDELLGRGSMTRTLGERREVKLAKEYQKQLEKEEGRHKDDFVFGAYQPTVASTAKGRPARRQPLRFSAEKNNKLKAEPLSKAPLSASQNPAWGRRNRSGWLGLKREEFFDLELSSPAKASPAGSSPSPAAAGQPGPARQLLAAEEAAAKTDPVEEEEDWLSAALARKKAQAQAKAQERTAKPSEVPGEGLNPGSPVSPPAASPGAQPQAAAVPDKAASTRSSRRMSACFSLSCGAAVHHSCLCAHAGHRSPGSAPRNKPHVVRCVQADPLLPSAEAEHRFRGHCKWLRGPSLLPS